MAERTELERDLLGKAAHYFPGNSTGNTNYPEELNFLIREGKAGRVWDVSGNEYVDWLMGSGPMIMGHAHPAVTEAVLEAVGRGSTFFANNDQAVMLAEELCKAIPCADKVRFTTSGTDACFQAMRAARAYTGKEKILKFEGGYHGTSDYAMMSVFASASVEFPQAESNSAGIPRALSDLMLVSQFNDLDTTAAIVEAHKDEIAAVIVEPLQRTLAPNPVFSPDFARSRPMPACCSSSTRWLPASGLPTAAPRNSMASLPTCAPSAKSWAAAIRWLRCWVRMK